MFTTRNGAVEVQAFDQGNGPVVLIVHPGLDDGTSWKKVAAALAPRFRVLSIVRRRYRLDLPDAGRCSIEEEARDVCALARASGGPVRLVGHSSGAIVALEALLLEPSAFGAALLYEPPLETESSVSEGVLGPAREAINAGKIAKAIRIFVHRSVQLPWPIALLAGLFVAGNKRMRALAPRQIDDLEAIGRLGNRLEAYRAIKTPVTLLGGTKSPAHLTERLRRLGEVLPHATTVMLEGQAHGAHDWAPRKVAELIAAL